MPETWLPCFDGVYEVSDAGRLRRSRGGRGTRAGKIIRLMTGTHGYRTCSISIDGFVRTVQVHRVVAEAFLGVCPSEHEVNHKNGERTDNRVENLEYVTHSANLSHSYEALGRRVNGAKLSPPEVRKMRVLRRAGQTYQSIADEFGVSYATAYFAANGHSWRRVS